MASDRSIDRLSEKMGIGEGGRRIGRVTLVRLLTYYGFALGAVALFVHFRPTPSLANAPGWTPGQPPPAAPGLPDPVRMLLDGTFAVLGAFLLAVPVAFVYVRTRTRLKYDQSLVQTVIMLPVVVTAILIVVHNSLALAFSLAGIVAAVRFKNDLKESRDAVYVFAAVGIGFAAGVHQLPVAALLSVIFSTLELALWKMDLTADHEKTFDLLCMPAPARAIAAAAHTHRVAVEKPEAATPRGLATPPAVPPLPAGGNGGGGKADRLRVYVTEEPSARQTVERVLEHVARKWKLEESRGGGIDQRVLDYSVRLPAELTLDHVIERLYAERDHRVHAAEPVRH